MHSLDRAGKLVALGVFVAMVVDGRDLQMLDQNYSLDVGDTDPPRVVAGPDITVRISEMAQLKPTVTAAPKALDIAAADVVPRRSSGSRVVVWWSKFRGPGSVTFGDGKTAPMAVSLLPGQESPLGTNRTECSNPPDMSCGHHRSFQRTWFVYVARGRGRADRIQLSLEGDRHTGERKTGLEEDP